MAGSAGEGEATQSFTRLVSLSKNRSGDPLGHPGQIARLEQYPI
jgi:hypothetical protein